LTERRIFIGALQEQNHGDNDGKLKQGNLTMLRIGADSSLIMPMVAPRMANLIIFVKNDESEAGNTVPTSVAPW
jgi:hypothetical protein